MSNLRAIQQQEQQLHNIRTQALRAAKTKRAEAVYTWKQEKKKLSEAVEAARKQVGDWEDIEFLELLLSRTYYKGQLILLPADFKEVTGCTIFELYQDALKDDTEEEEKPNLPIWTSICRFQDCFDAGTCQVNVEVYGTSKGYKGRNTVFTKCGSVLSITSITKPPEEMNTYDVYFGMNKKNKCTVEFLTGNEDLGMHRCDDVEADYKSSRVCGTYIAELYWLRAKVTDSPDAKRQKCNDDATQ